MSILGGREDALESESDEVSWLCGFLLRNLRETQKLEQRTAKSTQGFSGRKRIEQAFRKETASLNT